MIQPMKKACAACNRKDQYCSMCSLAVLNIPLRDLFKKHLFKIKLRNAFLNSEYARQTTLSAILKQPQVTWHQLNLVPGTGTKTIEAICSVIHLEMSLAHPREYSIANLSMPVGDYCSSDSENIDHDTLVQLRKVVEVWGTLRPEKEFDKFLLLQRLRNKGEFR